MVNVYGNKNGFDWTMNEPLCMQIVKLPILYPLEKTRETSNSFLVSLLFTFSLMLMALNECLFAGDYFVPTRSLGPRLERLLCGG